MATPHVCGAIGFMHAAASMDFHNDYITYPDSMALVLKQLLLANVDTVVSMRTTTASHGRLNLFRAAQAIHAYVSALPQPNLQYTGHTIDDAAGNNNGLLDRGETAGLIVSLINLGIDATNVTGVISSTDPYLSITDSTEPSGIFYTLEQVVIPEIHLLFPLIRRLRWNIRTGFLDITIR